MRRSMSRGESRKVYRKGHNRVHRMNDALAGLQRGGIRL